MLAATASKVEPKTGEFLTTKEVAAVLRVTTQTVRANIDEGKLPGYRVGKKWLVKQSDLEALFDR